MVKVTAEVEIMVELEDLMPNSLGTGAPEEGNHGGGVVEKNGHRKTAHAPRRWRRMDVTRWSVATRGGACGGERRSGLRLHGRWRMARSVVGADR